MSWPTRSVSDEVLEVKVWEDGIYEVLRLGQTEAILKAWRDQFGPDPEEEARLRRIFSHVQNNP